MVRARAGAISGRGRAWASRIGLVLGVAAGACSAANPLYSHDGGTGSSSFSSTAAGSTQALGPGGVDGAQTSGGQDAGSGGSQGATGSTSAGSTSTGSTSTAGSTAGLSAGMGSSAGTSGIAAGSTTADGVPVLGLPCGADDDCSAVDDAACCVAAQCAGTCMVPCTTVDDCPEPGMGCFHDYCLFPCSEDLDCEPWSGFTCQHMQQYCEND